jgi:hypothetical protein
MSALDERSISESGEDVAKLASLTERLEHPEHAVLYRTDLRMLGWNRRAVDAIFRECPNIVIEGYSRTVIRAVDYIAWKAKNTLYEDRVRGV